jgi:hypothetical protein
MSFRIKGLDPALFSHLYGLSDDALHGAGAKRFVVDAHPGFPDRIGLRDLNVGERALLLNFVHQPADTPYRASHAIFVHEGAASASDLINQIPEPLRIRPISLRAFDAEGQMVDADLVDGKDLVPLIKRFFENAAVSYLHAHFAKRGCFAARIDRA